MKNQTDFLLQSSQKSAAHSVGTAQLKQYKVQKMVWYPFQYNDLAGFKNDGIELGTSSNEAAKHYDAFITGVVFADDDPAYEQPPLEACQKADPNWMGPKIIQNIFMCMGNLRNDSDDN